MTARKAPAIDGNGPKAFDVWQHRHDGTFTLMPVGAKVKDAAWMFAGRYWRQRDETKVKKDGS